MATVPFNNLMSEAPRQSAGLLLVQAGSGLDGRFSFNPRQGGPQFYPDLTHDDRVRIIDRGVNGVLQALQNNGAGLLPKSLSVTLDMDRNIGIDDVAVAAGSALGEDAAGLPITAADLVHNHNGPLNLVPGRGYGAVMDVAESEMAVARYVRFRAWRVEQAREAEHQQVAERMSATYEISEMWPVQPSPKLDNPVYIHSVPNVRPGDYFAFMASVTGGTTKRFQAASVPGASLFGLPMVGKRAPGLLLPRFTHSPATQAVLAHTR